MHYGTNAERLAFTPSPPASGQPLYGWRETDTGNTYVYDTAWHLLAAAGAITTNTGAAGSEPGSPTSGDLYLPNNGVEIERYSGSAWAPWGPIFPFTAPVSGDFAWANQGGASVNTTNGGIYLLAPAGAGNNLRVRQKAAPATPYTITVCFMADILSVAFASIGVGWSDGTKYAVAQVSSDGTATYVKSSKYTDVTTFSANYVLAQSPIRQTVWFKLDEDGSNRTISYGVDGQHWNQFHQVGRTDFLTATQVCFLAESNNATYPAGMMLLSWKQA
jgi:hypothetical protein